MSNYCIKKGFYPQSVCITIYYLQLTIQASALKSELFTSTWASLLYIHSKEYSKKINQNFSSIRAYQWFSCISEAELQENKKHPSVTQENAGV